LAKILNTPKKHKNDDNEESKTKAPRRGIAPRLCDHRGKAPKSAKIKKTTRIVPSIVRSFRIEFGRGVI